MNRRNSSICAASSESGPGTDDLEADVAVVVEHGDDDILGRVAGLGRALDDLAVGIVGVAHDPLLWTAVDGGVDSVLLLDLLLDATHQLRRQQQRGGGTQVEVRS